METLTRKPFQGVYNIIRFNWHWYVGALLALLLLTALIVYTIGPVKLLFILLLAGIVSSTLVSLSVSYYVYDYFNFYDFLWLNRIDLPVNHTIVNIHAGLDESSIALKNKYNNSKIIILDFYDPALHTEISIRRARAAFPVIPETVSISTNHIPLPTQSIDASFLIFAAHEIRQTKERISFFKELKRIRSIKGKIILVEHQRDFYNFLAYNLGFFHFQSKTTWKKTFTDSGLSIENQFQITPFVTVYVLH